jgi:hypothetical protein
MKHRIHVWRVFATIGVVIATCGYDAVAQPEGSTSPGPVPLNTSAATPLRVDDLSLAFNLGQLQPWILGGANVEADLRIGPLVVGYSHGWSLDLEGSAIVGDMRRQKVVLHVPYTTGLGVGYSRYVDSVRSFFDVRFEAKLHRFEAAYQSADGKQRTRIEDYSTVTLGGGAYWTLVPFAKRSDVLRGLNVSTSVRFWPNVSSTLKNDAVTYSNTTTGMEETHKAANIGIANTPLIINISLGYVFQ